MNCEEAFKMVKKACSQNSYVNFMNKVKMKKGISKFHTIFFIASLLTAITAIADTSANSNNGTDNSAPQTDANDTTFSGYIDGSYNYLQNSNQFTSGEFDRVFDLAENGFTLQQAALTAAVQPTSGLGAYVNLLVGRDAFTTASYGFNPDLGLGNNLGFDAVQGYLQYVIDKLTIIGGKFESLAGAEYIDPTKNPNFSRSILGYSEPGTVTGVRATYAVNKDISLVAGLNNGWDNITDGHRRPTLELSVTDIVNPFLTLDLADYNGEERAEDRTSSGPTGTRNFLAILATITATKKLSFVTSYDYGLQTAADLPDCTIDRAVWQGVAQYVNYKFNDKWQATARAEYFTDRQGFITQVPQDWKELTLTVDYAPTKKLEFKAETRRDFSNVDSFFTKDETDAKNYQQSFAVEAYYIFA